MKEFYLVSVKGVWWAEQSEGDKAGSMAVPRVFSTEAVKVVPMVAVLVWREDE